MMYFSWWAYEVEEVRSHFIHSSAVFIVTMLLALRVLAHPLGPTHIACMPRSCPLGGSARPAAMTHRTLLPPRSLQIEPSDFTPATSLPLYDLQHHEILWQREVDAKCVVSWNDHTVVLAFRGTASLSNVVADLKVWRAVHPPKRGSYWLATRPMVHHGFMQVWFTSGLKQQVLGKLAEIMTAPRAVDTPWRVLLTGHSLGGALAQLAALDIATAAAAGELPLGREGIACYTYGCPRPGNHAFAREYGDKVPDSWDIMHLDDAVANGGKFIAVSCGELWLPCRPVPHLDFRV
jgi:hypothetical protein